MEYLRDTSLIGDGYLTESQSDTEWKQVTEVWLMCFWVQELSNSLISNCAAGRVHYGDHTGCRLVSRRGVLSFFSRPAAAQRFNFSLSQVDGEGRLRPMQDLHAYVEQERPLCRVRSAPRSVRRRRRSRGGGALGPP